MITVPSSYLPIYPPTEMAATTTTVEDSCISEEELARLRHIHSFRQRYPYSLYASRHRPGYDKMMMNGGGGGGGGATAAGEMKDGDEEGLGDDDHERHRVSRLVCVG